MLQKRWYRMKEGFVRRSEAINELNFIYKILKRLLPAIARRVKREPLGEELATENADDAQNLVHLQEVAAELGQPPDACECEEAADLVEGVYHADRSVREPKGRMLAIVVALQAVRMYLIRGWGRLLAAMNGEIPPAVRTEATEMQRREAKHHHDLVVIADRLEHGTAIAQDGPPDR